MSVRRTLPAALLLAAALTGCTDDPAADLPVQAAGTFTLIPADGVLLNSLPDETTRLDDEFGLRGPHGGLLQSWALVTDAVDRHEALNSGLPENRAPEGHELLLAGIDPPADFHWSYPLGEAEAPSAELVVGEKKGPLEGLPYLPPDGPGLDRGSPMILVASIPTGAPALLRLTDDGRAQTLDLRTGKRTEDALPGFYPRVSAETRVVVGKSDAVVNSGGTGTPTVVEYWMSQDPELTSYAPERGYAKEGRAWLRFPSVQLTDEYFHNVAARFDFGVTFTLTLPDGTELHPKGEDGWYGGLSGGSEHPESATLVFDIPDDVTEATFTFDAPSDIKATYSMGGPAQEYDASWSSRPKTGEFALTFPALRG